MHQQICGTDQCRAPPTVDSPPRVSAVRPGSASSSPAATRAASTRGPPPVNHRALRCTQLYASPIVAYDRGIEPSSRRRLVADADLCTLGDDLGHLGSQLRGGLQPSHVRPGSREPSGLTVTGVPNVRA